MIGVVFVLAFLGLFGKSKKLIYSLCLIIYKLKDLFGNGFSERAYSLFYRLIAYFS
jgi:hypothetical protein